MAAIPRRTRASSQRRTSSPGARRLVKLARARETPPAPETAPAAPGHTVPAVAPVPAAVPYAAVGQLAEKLIAPPTVTAESGPVRRFWARIRGGEKIPGLRTAKVAVATVLAFLVAQPLPSTEPPVLAALTALLVVQLTPYQTVRTGWQRVGSVVCGVLIALLLSAVVGLTWWSLGLLVLGALALGHALKLGDQILEVPISAMLVLSVGQTAMGAHRVFETLIGAAVGVLVSLFTPRVYVQPAGNAINDLAGQIAGVLRDTSADLGRAWNRDRLLERLRKARELERSVALARVALARAEESMRLNLNPRGLTTAHAPDSLRIGLTALEYAAINVRVICRLLVDRVDSVRGDEEDDLPTWVMRAALTETLTASAEVVVAFGQALAADPNAPIGDAETLRAALDRARAERDALTDALRVDPDLGPAIWRIHGALLAHTERLLTDLDPAATEVAASAFNHEPSEPAKPVLPVLVQMPRLAKIPRFARGGLPRLPRRPRRS